VRAPSLNRLLGGGEQRGTHCGACLGGSWGRSVLDPPAASPQLPLPQLRLLLPLWLRVAQGGSAGDISRLQALSHAAFVVPGCPDLSAVAAVGALAPAAAAWVLLGQASELYH
jgi:hypothetical protein